MLGAAAHERVMSGVEVWKVRRQAPGAPDRGVQMVAQCGARAEADSFGDAVDRQFAALQQLRGQVDTLLGETLCWQDRCAEAADLAEAIIAQDGPLGGELCDQDVPFTTPFAELHAGVPAGPRLLTAVEHIPAIPDRFALCTWMAGWYESTI